MRKDFVRSVSGEFSPEGFAYVTDAKQTSRFHAQVLIEELRYWVPSVKDVAQVQEVEDAHGWRLFMVSFAKGACPVELVLRNDGLFDIEIAGEEYEAQVLSSRNVLVTLLQRISEGRLIQRRYERRATGAPSGCETIVSLGDGAEWRAGLAPDESAGDGIAVQDRHFVPYRR